MRACLALIIALLALPALPGAALGAPEKAGRPHLPGPRATAAVPVRGDVLVELDRTAGERAVPALRLSGGRLVSRRLGIWRLSAVRARRILPGLIRARLVRLVQPDRRYRGLGDVAAGDPLLASEWWVAAVGADQLEPPGPGKPVTVLDSGLDVTHPEFAARPDLVLLNEQDVTAEGDDHGTAVASVLAAPANGIGVVGIYPQVTLNVWDTGDLSSSRIIEGLERAIDAGPGVINLSFGGTDFDPLVEEEILIAFGAGNVVVAASGNEFQEGNPLEFPASLNHVLTVAATDETGAPAYFSSSSLAVDLAAPGVRMPVAVPLFVDPSGFATYDGTSFSAPLVSGATAWVWTVRPELDNTQVFELIRHSARDVGPRGYDVDTGFGVLDLPAALARKAPVSDQQEPNDDIDHVRANGLFKTPTRPITAPGRPRARFEARLDVTEDPEDVYRVWVPARRAVEIVVRGDANVDLELWRAGTPTVFARGSARRKFLIEGSYRAGRRADRVRVENTDSRGVFVYADVFLPRNGPIAAAYELSARTVR